jgi:ribosomal protein L37AE/L43A
MKAKVKAAPRRRKSRQKFFCPYCMTMVSVKTLGYLIWCDKCGQRID